MAAAAAPSPSPVSFSRKRAPYEPREERRNHAGGGPEGPLEFHSCHPVDCRASAAGAPPAGMRRGAPPATLCLAGTRPAASPAWPEASAPHHHSNAANDELPARPRQQRRLRTSSPSRPSRLVLPPPSTPASPQCRPPSVGGGSTRNGDGGGAEARAPDRGWGVGTGEEGAGGSRRATRRARPRGPRRPCARWAGRAGGGARAGATGAVGHAPSMDGATATPSAPPPSIDPPQRRRRRTRTATARSLLWLPPAPSPYPDGGGRALGRASVGAAEENGRPAVRNGRPPPCWRAGGAIPARPRRGGPTRGTPATRRQWEVQAAPARRRVLPAAPALAAPPSAGGSRLPPPQACLPTRTPASHGVRPRLRPVCEEQRKKKKEKEGRRRPQRHLHGGNSAHARPRPRVTHPHRPHQPHVTPVPDRPPPTHPPPPTPLALLAP